MHNEFFQQVSKSSKDDRRLLNGHGSCCIWLTGLSASGKTTIAVYLERELYRMGVRTYIIDGDNIRKGLNSDLGFSEQDRKENIRRVGELARILVDAGLVTIVSLISPFRDDRNKVRKLFEQNEFIEVYIKCPIEVCKERDPKGLYKKAERGEIGEFTGISSPYEPPDLPEIVIETDKFTVYESINKIVSYLIKDEITNSRLIRDYL